MSAVYRAISFGTQRKTKSYITKSIWERKLGISDYNEVIMTFVLKVLKCIFGLCSGALSILLLLYVGLKNEAWEILTSDGQVVVNKTMGICLIVAWAVRSTKQTNDKKER